MNSFGKLENRRFAMVLEVRFKTISGEKKVYGTGYTTWVGSRELLIRTNTPLEQDMQTELAIAWPLLLDGQVRLQLVIQGTITQCFEGLMTVRITKYHFRTRGDWDRPEKPALRDFVIGTHGIDKQMAATAQRLEA